MAVHVELPPPEPPRAPSQARWDAMTPDEQRAVVNALPGFMHEDELCMPEGDPHFEPKSEGRDTLRTYFDRANKRIYVSSELTVYYPGEKRFSPDLLAVRDVDPHSRTKWVVSAEGKGLDWVLEVLVSGDRRKDLEQNVTRYARLLIAEYFVFDRERNVLRGWRLPDPKIGIYKPMVAQRGVLHSSVLDLDLQIEGDRLRFKQGSALVLAPSELILRLEQDVTDLVVTRENEAILRADAERRADEATQRADEAAQRADEAAQRADEAAQETARERLRADEAEQRLQEALRELEQLRASR